jgi:hypothetical protein
MPRLQEGTHTISVETNISTHFHYEGETDMGSRERIYAGDFFDLGLTRSQVRHWTARGYLRPVRNGRFAWRQFGRDDLERARRMLYLMHNGMTLAGAARLEQKAIGKCPRDFSLPGTPSSSGDEPNVGHSD